jgi:glycosyltransferase involved in cell wall biosynthesis
MPQVSVVLSTFDQPNAFAFCLTGYQRQTTGDFELIIADDGSDEETRAIVERFKQTSPFPIKHVWQPNQGYRKARIANEAVRVSEGRLILLSDGDCIPHRDFVKAHLEHARKGGFCAGGYVRLSAAYCRTLTEEKVRAGEYEDQMTLADRRRFRITHWKSVLGVLLGSIKKPKAYGCNISVDRDVYYAVNGYDENHDGFGKEDSDLRNRLRRYGAKPVSVWEKAWVYHVDDAIDPKIRRRIPRADGMAYYRRARVPIRCENGIVKGPQASVPPP